jgi:pimeloyl-ACP methyl ester carboxylesterase
VHAWVGQTASMDDTFTSTSTIEVNNTSLAIQERGRGDPVVFVHGAVSDLRTWSSQLAAVGVRHRAVAYSCR